MEAFKLTKVAGKRSMLKRAVSYLLALAMLTSLFTGIIPENNAKAAASSIVIDGTKDAAWDSVPVLARSADAGWQGTHIDNLRLTNDDTYLYFWMDAANVPNWGDNGMYINMALNINDTDSGKAGNPWFSQFNFNGTQAKPNYHIVMRLKQDDKLSGAAVYKASDYDTPVLSTWTNDLNGAQFAVVRTGGFEGKVPLSSLGLKDKDKLKAIVVLGGNTSNEHGAFDVIPQDDANSVASAWSMSGKQNVETTYSQPYTVSMAPVEPLALVSTTPADNAAGVATSVYNVEVNFNQPISVDSKAAITVQDETAAAPLAGMTFSATDSKLNIKLANNLTFEHKYTVNVPAGTVSGVPSATSNAAIKFSFTARSSVMNPDVNGNQVKFTYKGDGTELKVAVKGSFNQWAADYLTKDASSNVWTLTKTIPAGAYEYGFVTWSATTTTADGDWKGDTTNPVKINTNAGFYVAGILITAPEELQLGDTAALKAKLSDEIGVVKDITPVWSLETPKDGVSIKDGNITIASTAKIVDGEKINIVATSGNYTSKKTISLYNVMYDYTINYFRYDGKQANWDMWVFADGMVGQAFTFNKGMVGDFAQGHFKYSKDKITVITRLSDWSAQDANRIIQVKQGKNVEVWLVDKTPEVYYSKDQAVITPKVKAAMMDSDTEIYVTTTHLLDDSDLSTFKLIDADAAKSGSGEIAVTPLKLGDNTLKLTVQDPSKIDVRKLYKVQSKRFSDCNVTMRRILDGSKYFYNGSDLGLKYSKASSTFKVWAPTAAEVSLALSVDPDTTKAGAVTQKMTRADNGVWSVTLDGNQAGKYYTYRVSFADGTVNNAIDPYASAVSANGVSTAIVDIAAANPTNWDPKDKPAMISPTDAVIYELHVRDLSIDSNSGVVNKGKFKAFTESGTVGPNGVKTGIDHLAELGVTHVHLLPSFDFGSVNELKVNDPKATDAKYNWGYDPQNYNVPEGSYSTDPSDPNARIKEFKEMVQALHKKGIRVIMDVVYNHTYTVNDGPFNKVVPGYFYRTDDAGTYTNGSGCNNEIASERPMVRKYIKDSVKYWANEYGVDGFRFDLMGVIDTDTMTQLTKELQEKIDPTIMVYGEPWSGGSSALPISMQTQKGAQKGKNFAVFNDNLRGAIKGGSDDASKGFATGETGLESKIVAGVKGSVDDFTDSPSETINYVTAHDNLALWDKIIRTQGTDAEKAEGFLNIDGGVLKGDDAATYKDDVAAAVAGKTKPHSSVDKANVLANETVKRDLLANAIVFTSQGIPFIQAGEEMLRTKYGEKNSYLGPDAINQLRWQWKADYKPVFDYYKGLIDLRKAHPAFRMNSKSAIYANMSFFKQDENVVAYQLKNFANGDTWKNIVVIYNANSTDKQITLPSDATWNVVVDDKNAGNKVLRQVTGSSVKVAGLSTMVLYDEAAESYTPAASSIELKPAMIGIQKGDERVMKAVVKDQKGRVMPDAEIKWSVDNVIVASAAGEEKDTVRISALSNGQAVVTATSGSAKATLTVNVADLTPKTIFVSGIENVFASRTIQLSALVNDQFGQQIQNADVKWESSDTSIATVDASGKVTGIKAGHVSITAKAGTTSAVKQVKVSPYVRRYIIFKYVRPKKDYDKWNIWVWNSGVKDGEIDFKSTSGVDSAVAEIEVAPEATKVGFVLRKGTDWSEKDPYGSDRYITVEPSDVYTKATITSGVADIATVTSAKSPILKDGSITFNYRDNDLFRDDKMNTIEGVKVKVNDQEYDMVYDAANELYTSQMQDVSQGDYLYTFIVKKDGVEKEILDPQNPKVKNNKSLVTYSKPNVTLKAAVLPDEINYNQNALLKLSVSSDKADTKYQEIYADLSALGGSSKYAIDPEIMETAISVSEATTVGDKTIPITVVDEFGNKYTTSATVKVVAKTTKGPLDFDWDESRIYFIVTDRFFDGDTSNDNPQNIPGGYDKTNLETFHGGDLKGITQKLDYIKDLGANTIWITPIVDNIDWNLRYSRGGYQYAYHGYWAKDFTKLDEHLGSVDDLKELIQKAHDKGIKIMVDVVLNHAGYDMDSSKLDGVSNYPTDKDREIFKGMFRDGGNDTVKGSLNGLPDFKTEDPAVRQKLIDWQTAWLDKARTDRGDTIDYFRVDTVKHVDDTTWKSFKDALAAKDPNFKLLGEYFGGDVNNNGGYLNSGEMDSIFDFAFKDSALNFVNGKISDVEKYLEERNAKMNDNATLAQFLSSHDVDGFLYRANNDKGKLKAAASLMITAKGQPVVYYGEEVGLSGKSAGDFDAGELSENRKDMPWDNMDNNLRDHFKKLLKSRADHSKLFAKGTRTLLGGGDAEGYDAFEVSYNNESVAVFINTLSQKKSLKGAALPKSFTPGSKIYDEYNQKAYTVEPDGTINIDLPSKDEGGTVILSMLESGDASSSLSVDEILQSMGSSINAQKAAEVLNKIADKKLTSETAKKAITKVIDSTDVVDAKTVDAIVKIINKTLGIEVASQTDANGNKVVSPDAEDVTGVVDALSTSQQKNYSDFIGSLDGGLASKLDKKLNIDTIMQRIQDNLAVQITAKDAKQGETVQFTIPSEALNSIMTDELVLKLVSGDMTITLPAASIDKSLVTEDASLSVTVKPYAEKDASNVRKNITNDDPAMTSVSNAYKVEIKVVGSDGKETKVETFNISNPKLQPTIELKLDAAELKAIEDKRIVGVYMVDSNGKVLNDKGQALKFVGGLVQGNTIVFNIAKTFDFTTVSYAKTFNDIENHWAKGNIEILAARQIAFGSGTGDFNPDEKVTRGQFATFVCRAFGIEQAPFENLFTDVKKDDYFAGSVIALYKLGLIKGYGNNFGSKDQITREDMVVLMMRVYTHLTGVEANAVEGASSETFNDMNSIVEYAKDSVKAFKAMKVVEGSNGKFDPKGTSTRAQIAKVIIQLLTNLEKISEK